MFKILDLYIGRTIIATTSICLVTLVGLSGIIKYVEQLRKVGRGTYDLLHALYFVLLSVPRDIELFFPMAALLGALIALGTLATSSELTVMQAAGYSKVDIGMSVLKTALPLMLLVMLLGEWGAPQAQKMARDLRTMSISGGHMVSTRTGVWAKDGDDFIYIGNVNEQKLKAINIWEYDKQKELMRSIFAQSADYIGDKTWQLKHVTTTLYTNETEISKKKEDTLAWKTTLEPDRLEIVTVKPEELSLTGLYGYVTYLKDSEQDASRYELAFWRKITQPLSIAVMMMLALSFVFGPLRSVTMGARILSGVIAGFSFYISSEFFGPLSVVYQIPPMWGALAPSVAFMLVAIILLRRKL
ncbi:lipopolysaccharide ABC transporter permease LptG [Vibrio sp. UCD-FRSSP16_10]|uniref:LPS export ABC transporter permease LptG n=1 Tax=unclassified Vibrio TaxID=2614977 RepID=UPI0008021683|nr:MULTISPECIES: LPS export ABC transporter permease LptG [unclassified Vibrio]OBT17396.1 lipopolysaccharide ABC transporter permease LptG [Vibrio sp. UCD-FRSSP16_30]OBT23165.1 lipopolysaccharide ABC transporter permease LptG [Vibrio sp. UCD-FRSSP16_10]